MSEYAFDLRVRFQADSQKEALGEARRLSTIVFEDDRVLEVEAEVPEVEA